jgi:cystathionine beta-lyase
MAKKITKPDVLKPETRLVTAAREFSEHGVVNPAVYHASTILFPSVEAFQAHSQTYVYGRRGTPISRALERAIAETEGGYDTRVCASGLAAITTALLSFLKTGDHLLMTDAVYGPIRHFCNGILKRYGVEVTYYDPAIGANITELMRAQTRIVYMENPGSQTMDMQDVAAIADAAHARRALVMLDNTWSAGYYFKAFDHGCDVSMQSGTKYIGGHADVMLGSVTCTGEAWPEFKEGFGTLGQFAGPDDMYLTLRGLRTLDVRLDRHMKNGLAIAEWLRSRPEVAEVLHPGLPGARGHELWKRDFTGASGLFSVVLKTSSRDAMAAMLDGLELFGMGDSWGGYESLVVPFDPRRLRSATGWTHEGQCLRFHIGLDSTDDLKADLQEGFKRLIAAG